MNLPEPTRENWHKWTDSITPDFIGEIMGQHPAWLKIVSGYERTEARRNVNRLPESAATNHLKVYLHRLLHTETA